MSLPRSMSLPALLAALLPVLPFVASGCATEEAQRQANMLEIYESTAESYYQLQDNDRAIGQAMKALEADPDNLKMKLILGWSLQRRGSTEDVRHAEQVFRSVAEEQDIRAPLGLATSLERLGVANIEAAEALESGKRITEAPDPKVRAAELRERSIELWTEAATWYEATLALQKSNIDALNGLQRIEALLGRPESSLAHSRQLIETLEIDRNFWEARIRKAQLGEQEERTIRRTIAQIVDLEVATRLHAAQVEDQLGNADRAMVQLDAAILLNPERADLHGMRAVVQQQLGNWDSAIADAERFIALSRQGYDGRDVKRAFDLIESCEAKRSRQQP